MASATDWESIEADYRAGLLSTREIAAQHSISHTAINKRAKAEAWDRDLSAKIQAKAEALVSRRMVSIEVSRNPVSEREIIEANAERIAQVRSDHRVDIGKARALATKLLAELEHQTDNGELYEGLAELLDGTAEEDHRKRAEAFQRAMGLPSRTKTMKDLAETLRVLVALEREAYGLDTAAFGDSGKKRTAADLTDEDLAAIVAGKAIKKAQIESVA